MPGGGPRLCGGMTMPEGVRLARIGGGPPFMGPPFIIGRCCGGAEDNRGGGWPITDAGGDSCRGLLWLTILAWCIIAYRDSIRGTRVLDSRASLIGDPRKVSISIGRRAWKSWYIVVGASVAVIFSIVFSRKSLGNEQPWAEASSINSSMMPVTT
jgi:hypothetical protein